MLIPRSRIMSIILQYWLVHHLFIKTSFLLYISYIINLLHSYHILITIANTLSVLELYLNKGPR